MNKISSDKIKESLTKSAEKVAHQIVQKKKEIESLSNETTKHENDLTLLEAKIATYKDKIEKFHDILQEKKIAKTKLFSKREELIEKKRFLQNQLTEIYVTDKSETMEKISVLSDQIGEVIEESKLISKAMQDLYDEIQDIQQIMLELQDQFYEKRTTSQNYLLGTKKKISQLETEIKQLQKKMKQIYQKLA